jgi:transposase-like protein
MAKNIPRAYPPEFRHKVLELVRSGRSVAEASRQYELTANDHELDEAR